MIQDSPHPILGDRTKVKNHSVIEQIALGLKDIAESMIALAESRKYVGGTILEVAKGQPWKEVPGYNAPPPVGVGAKPEQTAKTSEFWIY